MKAAPYDHAALLYRAAGWWPIPTFVPVGGKTKPVVGATGYGGTVTDEKIAAWLFSSPEYQVGSREYLGEKADSIAVRHQLTIALDIDDGYGDKNGVAALGKYGAGKGLSTLPATWSSTARGDDSPSRQYVYRIVEDVKFKTKPCDSVELCPWHHRYTVCWPSIHPRTGNAYRWYEPGQPGVPPSWGPHAQPVEASDLVGSVGQDARRADDVDVG